MDEKLEHLMGHGKEVVGEATGNDKLKREGKLDQFSADVKGKGHKAGDELSHSVDRAVDKGKDFAHRRGGSR